MRNENEETHDERSHRHDAHQGKGLRHPERPRRQQQDGDAGDRRPGGHRAGRHVDHARRRRPRHHGAEAVRHRQPRPVRLLPSLPRRDRRPPRNAGLVHHARRPGHQGHDAERPPRPHPQGRDGALHLRPPARLPDLRRQRRLRAAGHGGRRRPARRALRLRRREPRLRAPERRSQSALAAQGHVEPLLPVRAVEVHRLLALRARLRGGAGHVRADHRRPRLCLARLRQHGRGLPFIPSASPAAPACRPARPRR